MAQARLSAIAFLGGKTRTAGLKPGLLRQFMQCGVGMLSVKGCGFAAGTLETRGRGGNKRPL